MFYEYNYDNFPIIFVKFNGSISSENDFDNFLKEWLLIYHDSKDFTFIFDTRDMKNINIKYAIKLTLFIKKLRKQPYQYLQKSLILVNDKNIKRLLDFVFTLQSPVSPVYLWLTDEDDKYLLINTINNINRFKLEENMIYIKENNSLISFL